MVWAFQDWMMPLLGLLAGMGLGAIARAHRFCTMSALERYWFGNDSVSLRTWAFAGASALVATQTMMYFGIIDISNAFYLTAAFSPLMAIGGGIAFGYGMALTGTCGFGALVRVGGGNLRSLIVLIVIGISALSVQRGALAPLRIEFGHLTAFDLRPYGGQSAAVLVSRMLGTDLVWPVTAVLACTLLLWIFREKAFRKNASAVAAGAGTGLIVAFGWLATHWGRTYSFEPVQLEAASFIMPVGDVVSYLGSYTGAMPDYGMSVVAGVVLGAALVAYLHKDVRWEACDDARELGRHLVGAVLMGVGGVFAMGCTIGQGVSAVSTLAISTPFVLFGIGIGAKMGLAHLFEGSPWRAFVRSYGTPAE